MPNQLVNGILQFRPNKWFMNTSVYPTDWPTEFSSSGQTTGLRIQLVYNCSTNTSLCPIDWSTEFSSSGQTSGLRIPVYARPIGQRKSPVRAKQLVYEYQFMPDRSVNGILQFRPNNWSTNTSLCPTDWSTGFSSSCQTTGLRIPVYAQPIGQRNSPVQAKQMVFAYQCIPDRLANGILQFRPNNWSMNTSLCPIDWSTEFSSSGQTSGLRIPVYARPIGQRKSPVRAKQLVYEYQIMPDRLANGNLQFRSNNWSTNRTVLQLVNEYQFMPNWLVNRILQFRPNNWLWIPVYVYAQPIVQWNSPVQAKQLVYRYNWSTDASLCPTDRPTEFSSSCQTTGLRIQQVYNRSTNTSLCPTDWSTESEFSSSGQTTGLRIQLVYEYQFIPNWLANGILQFRPNNWSMNTTGLQLVYEYLLLSNRMINGILQFRPNKWSTNTSLCPTDRSTKISSSGQTTGLRIPIYARPVDQRNSPVQAKQLVYE